MNEELDRIAIEALLEQRLSPSDYALVKRAFALQESKNDVAHDAHETALIDELARHFGCLAPAVRVVAAHCDQQSRSDVGRCCTPASGADHEG
jgi:hypothetical protein